MLHSCCLSGCLSPLWRTAEPPQCVQALTFSGFLCGAGDGRDGVALTEAGVSISCWSSCLSLSSCFTRNVVLKLLHMFITYLNKNVSKGSFLSSWWLVCQALKLGLAGWKVLLPTQAFEITLLFLLHARSKRNFKDA